MAAGGAADHASAALTANDQTAERILHRCFAAYGERWRVFCNFDGTVESFLTDDCGMQTVNDRTVFERSTRAGNSCNTVNAFLLGFSAIPAYFANVHGVG